MRGNLFSYTQFYRHLTLTAELTFSVLSLSSSTLAWSAAEAFWYSSSRWYAAKDEARENPNRKPTTLWMVINTSKSTARITYPPRKPPTGFFWTWTAPTVDVASLRVTAVVWIPQRWETGRASLERQAKRANEAICSWLELKVTPSSPHPSRLHPRSVHVILSLVRDEAPVNCWDWNIKLKIYITHRRIPVESQISIFNNCSSHFLSSWIVSRLESNSKIASVRKS